GSAVLLVLVEGKEFLAVGLLGNGDADRPGVVPLPHPSTEELLDVGPLLLFGVVGGERWVTDGQKAPKRQGRSHACLQEAEGCSTVTPCQRRRLKDQSGRVTPKSWPASRTRSGRIVAPWADRVQGKPISMLQPTT